MPDFFHERTVRWDYGEVILIDQTKLPNRFVTVRCKSPLDIADAISKMVVRGAPAIGAAAAMGIALAAQNSRTNEREKLIAELYSSASMLRRTRPTGVNLFWGIERVLEKAKSTDGSVKMIRDAVLKEAISIGEEDIAFNRSMGAYGASLLEDGETVLTHCK